MIKSRLCDDPEPALMQGCSLRGYQGRATDCLLPFGFRTRCLGWNGPCNPAKNSFQGFPVGEPRDAALGHFSARRQVVQGRAYRVKWDAGCGGDLGVEALAVLSQVLKDGRVVHLDAPGED